jgi:hypothetical protein
MGPDWLQRCARCGVILKDHRPGADLVLMGDSGGVSYAPGDLVVQGRGYQALALSEKWITPTCVRVPAERLEFVVDELVYRNYAANRRQSPHVSPARWGRIFDNVEALEARYQDEGRCRTNGCTLRFSHGGACDVPVLEAVR